MRLDGRTLEIREAAKIDRTVSGIGSEELGQTLQDGKTFLKRAQERIVENAVEIGSVTWKACMHCHQDQRINDLRSRRIRTVFQPVNVLCRRYIRCTCRRGKPWVMRPPWLSALKRSTPEFRYLFAEWGSKAPHRRAVEMFDKFLPLAEEYRTG